MNSVMKHDFSRIPKTEMPRSTFDRSHGLKTAFQGGYLVPIECQEVLPGDEVDITANMLGRLAPMVTPVMDNVFLDTQWFFVPSRLLWTNFTKMMGERVNPSDSIDYTVPMINSGEVGFDVGSLADYFGIPTNVPNLDVSVLPFRAYAKIWDDWYRDENLQDSIIQSSSDLGDDTSTLELNVLRKRGKRHDYFTSCLPWPQKGEGVELSLSGFAPVKWQGNNEEELYFAGKPVAMRQHTDPTMGLFASDGYIDSEGEPQNISYVADHTYGDKNAHTMYADLSSASMATINSLRLAFQIQRQLESDARCGTRYCEIIAGAFKTICPDARLQRPEYLGGSSDLIQINPVAQTSATVEDGETPQGNLVANPKVFSKLRIHKSFTEHGYLIGLANVRCDLNYQQGLNRMWSRKSRFDFFWPTLQNIGEQAVLNKEIYAQGASVLDGAGQIIDDQVFGYQERFAEYRYNPSIITGRMRSTAENGLGVWHLAQQFDSLPVLNSSFIEDSPPLARVLAYNGNFSADVILDCYFSQKWTRPMLTYSIPGLIDHL